MLTSVIIGLMSIFLLSEFAQDSFAQYMGNVDSEGNTSSSFEKTLSPLKQFRDGQSPETITCNENLELLIKNNEMPVCVTTSTKVILMERLGWTEPEISSSHTNQNNAHLEKFPYKLKKEIFIDNSTTTTSAAAENIIKFSSPSEIVDFLKEAQKPRDEFRRFDTADLWVSSEESTSSGGYMGNAGGSYTLEESLELQRRSIESGPSHGGVVSFDGQVEYSATNTQVDLVDEPDYIKTDGKYIYLVNQNTLTIIDAYPAETAKILHKVALDIESQDLENIFLNGDKLVVLYRGSSQLQILSQENRFDSSIAPYPIYNSNTVVSILDISDRENPQLLSEYEIDGDYHDSRMIGNIVYLIANSYADYDTPIIPRIFLASENTTFMPDVYRFPNPEKHYNFNTIAAIDVSSNSMVNSETFLMGNSNTIYVSESNLYITYQKNIAPKTIEDIQREMFFDIILPLLPQGIQEQITSMYDDSSLTSSQKQDQISEIIQESYNTMSKQDKEELFAQMQKAVKDFEFQIQRDLRQTAVHKIALDEGHLTYVANAHVPGHLLNQFSMDENNDEKFRVATTSQNDFRRENSDTSNNVYVLDVNLNRVGSLEDIAPGERIYSARFMGDNLYLVTFKEVDPFFVIDLSEDTPKVLGELKIPGFSNYLQAYDENHIIGIGRDTIESKNGRVQTEGIKISMFDVSDFENPREKDTIIIGDSDTDSDILYSHKALLLDKAKNVMSIPIKTSIASITLGDTPIQDEYDEDYYYDRHWNGFYIYGFVQDGFVERGTITHHQYKYHYNLPYMQPRSFYIADALYTVMDGSLKINDIEDIQNEINSVNLTNTGQLIKFVE